MAFSLLLLKPASDYTTNHPLQLARIHYAGEGEIHIAVARLLDGAVEEQYSAVGYLHTNALNGVFAQIERLLDKTDLLILDELSYMSFNKYESELLFKVISDRSERSSTIITTNLPFSRWIELFENNTLVSALVDRLTFRSHVLDMSGPSYRLLTAQASANQ